MAIEKGPVGTLLKVWNRHNMRAAHVHFSFQVPGYRPLITQLYPTGDKWATTDCVFAPKKSLLIVSFASLLCIFLPL